MSLGCLKPLPLARHLWVLVMGIGPTWSWAAPERVDADCGRVSLSASAVEDVPQDSLTVLLTHRHEGRDAAAVQRSVAQVVDAALQLARQAARLSPGLEVSSQAFSVLPRHDKEGQVTGWVGRADIRLHGRNMPAVSELSTRLPGMVVSELSHSLSRETATQWESQLRLRALARFREGARETAQAWGATAYQLDEIQIETGLPVEAAPMRTSRMAVALMASPPLPAEPGLSRLEVNVRGSVQLRPCPIQAVAASEAR